MSKHTPKLPKLLETAPFAQFGPQEYECIRAIVNAHDDLVAALKILRLRANVWHTTCDAEAAFIEAALAKAGVIL